MRKLVIQFLVALVAVCGASFSHSSDINLLTIEGVIGPGDVGSYPVDSGFSWIDHRYPDADASHIWQLAAGTDGGVLPGQAQPGKGALTEVRPMYNINSWLYTVDSGITFNPDDSIDFGNLRMKWGTTILNLGMAPGFDPLVPLVSDISLLTNAGNGYVVHGDGSYDLIYRSAGLCEGCELTVHFHGIASSVPEPGISWLWLFGLALVSFRLPWHALAKQSKGGASNAFL